MSAEHTTLTHYHLQSPDMQLTHSLTHSLLGEKLASPSIGFTSRCVLMVFTYSANTPPEVNQFGGNLGHSEYIVCRWPWQILGAICAEATARERGKFCFLSGKQRTS